MKKQGFLSIFVIGGILIEGARGPWPSPGYAYAFEIRSRASILS